MTDTIKTLAKVILDAKDKGTSPYDTTAEVVRIDGQTAWCHIAGGIDETPVNLTIAASVGDTVQVRIAGGRAWITGNQSAPPTDDKKATAAQKSADKAKITADDAKVTADNAESLATKANRAAQNVNQYFWHTETDTGAGAGAHITEVTKEEFLDDPDNGGGNLLAQSGGIFIRDGLEELASMTVDGQFFNNEYSLPVFENGRTERRTYNNKIAWYKYSNESPFQIVLAWDVTSINHVYGYDNNRDNVYTVAAANYSLDGRTLTIDATACSALTSANVKDVVVWYKAEGRFPYLTFGSRIDSANVGNYSAVIGENNVASGATSVAFGDSNRSSGVNSFSAGIDNFAQYANSAAFGEGNLTRADRHFVVGKFNDPNVAHLFTVGNGTDDNNRSNAFYVTGSGSITAAGDITANGNISTDGDIFMQNAEYIYADNNGGTARNILGINASNQLIVGYGLYANDEGTTYIEGNNVQILSKNDVKASNAGGTAHCVGTMDTMTTTQHSTSTGSVAATTDSGDKSATFTKAGYYPLGIVGINMAGTNRMYQNIYEYRLSSRSSGSATLTYRFRNSSSAAFSGTLYVDILWIKI